LPDADDADDIRFLVKHLQLGSADDVLALCAEILAAQLVHESGTTHLPVAIWTVKGGLLVNDEVNSYLVELLKKLDSRPRIW
jgi:hypothetical protein